MADTKMHNDLISVKCYNDIEVWLEAIVKSDPCNLIYKDGKYVGTELFIKYNKLTSSVTACGDILVTLSNRETGRTKNLIVCDPITGKINVESFEYVPSFDPSKKVRAIA